MVRYRDIISVIISISFSAFAIFSADEGWGRPKPGRKDMSSEFRGRRGWLLCMVLTDWMFKGAKVG